MTSRDKLSVLPLLVLSTAILALPRGEARAMITGGEGNKALGDPGWPKGAAAVFNTKARIAWWEGPPFGGGNWHAECRGDAKALSAVLADFAGMDVKSKRVVLHDGVGRSVWLKAVQQPGKQVDVTLDWNFHVWQASIWEQLRKLPPDLNPVGPKGAEVVPPSVIDVYTGGNVRWAEVNVPDGLKIDDQRLEAHGFSAADGMVLEGKVIDIATGKPVAATLRLQHVEPLPNNYRYTAVAQAVADAAGHWVLKKTPAGWQRVVIEAEGYVPRVIGYIQSDGQPCWREYHSGLSRPAVVAGLLSDETGRPLAGVEVQILDLATESGESYKPALDDEIKTGDDGRFRAERVPIGRATIWVRKPGYCRPGLGLPITTPKTDVALSMSKSARAVVTVDFKGKDRPEGYIVEMKPEGGDVIGSYGGSGNIDVKNQYAIQDVPPGRYTFSGRPNPSDGKDQTKAVTVDLKGGESAEVTLEAH